MKRREFLVIAGGGAAVLLPIPVYAQKAPLRIGLLASGAEGSLMSRLMNEAVKQGLSEQALVDGRDYVLDVRYSAGDYSRFPQMAQELAQAGARVIMVNTIASVRAAQSLRPPVPVVMLAINDPVGAGLVASLAKPGGVTTGMATLNEDLTPKILEFQRTILPNASTIAAIFNPANPTNLTFLNDLRMAAEKIGMTVQPVELTSPSALQPAFSSLAAKRPDVLQIISDSGTLDLVDQIAALALANRIPSFASNTAFARVGGLLAYGPSRMGLIKRSAYFVKRIILDGMNAGDLPVEQPTRIELIVNLRTANALGLTIPFHLQQLADEVIE